MVYLRRYSSQLKLGIILSGAREMKRNLYFYLSKQSNFETEEFRKHDLNLQTYDQFACMKGQLIKHV